VQVFQEVSWLVRNGVTSIATTQRHASYKTSCMRHRIHVVGACSRLACSGVGVTLLAVWGDSRLKSCFMAVRAVALGNM
jgi:hypothetical protein